MLKGRLPTRVTSPSGARVSAMVAPYFWAPPMKCQVWS